MYATPPVQAPAAPSVGEPVTRDNIVIGGRYNWKNQPERLVYMGLCEPRNGRWHQFAKVEDPAVCWSEVTDDDLSSFEVTPPAAPAAPSVGEPDDNYDPEIPVTRSLLIAAVHELARYALPAGADDQVIANLSACCGIATPPAAPPATEAPSDLTNAELADHVEVIAAGFAMPEYPQAYRNTMRARLLDAANRLRAPTTAAAVGASDWQAKRDLMDRLDARDAGACIQHVHREWRSALTVAIETLETEREHRSEGGHDADAAKMKRAETILRTMLEATPVQPVPESLSLLAKKHEGMRVDYSGLLGQCQRALRHKGESANAEMLRQLQCHLKELGERWYGGDTDVVDEILQLYCIEKDARAALATTSSAASEVKP
ncbi:MAG TPA: hypothetical protein VFI87_11145 [Hyphomicrobiaceae bacterium]|nr:hypothetical protein [Hyphomicrobiaceae bacterium]